MNYANWSTLKTASKVAFKKIAAVAEVKNSDGEITTSSQPAYTVLEKKVYNPDTGAESTIQKKINLHDLETDKAQKISEKAKLTTEITELGKMITQIKKV